MRRLLAVLLLCTGCSRSLQLPDGAPLGGVSGRVVRGVPGRAVPEPVEGAVVQLLGSGLSVTTSPGGTFELSGVESPGASLLARVEVEGVTLQRVVPLARFGVGPSRQVNLGDVVLGPSATLRGRVRLKNVLPAAGGHFGTAVFVPRGPFTAFTSDDGSFTLEGLPAGSIELQAFHAGYAPHAAGTVEVQGGQTLTMSDVELVTAPAGAGSLSGRLTFVPPAEGAGDSAVQLLVPGGSNVPLTVNADGTFSATNVPAALLTVEATRSGYTRTRVPNVLVVANAQAALGDVILSQGPEVGSETPVTPDGGPVTDAGVLPDGGTSIACDPSTPCAAGTYCDDGRCRPFCTSNATCDDFRICNLGNGRCFRPCTQGCGPGQICDNSPDAGIDGGIGACLDYCDGTFRCGAFERCGPQSFCIPECVVNGDCPSTHSTCTSNGQCVFDGTCDTDLDCPVNQACGAGQCLARPSAPLDAGLPYTCTSSACDCRLGEACLGGLCVVDEVPTHYVTADAGAGTGRSPLSPTTLAGALVDAGPGSVIALREADLFVQSASVGLGGKPGLVFSGGYHACGPTRWVRGDPSTTTIRGPATNVTLQLPAATNVKVRSLTLESAGQVMNDGLVNVQGGSGVEVSHVRGTLNTGASLSLVELNGTANFVVRDVTLLGATNPLSTVYGVDITGSFGTVDGLTVTDGLDISTFTAVRISSTAGETLVRRVKTGTRHARSTDIGIDVVGCAPNALTLERNELGWPYRIVASSSAGVSAIVLAGCAGFVVKDNVIGLGSSSSQLSAVTGIDVRSAVSGTLQSNEVYLPRTNQSNTLTGVLLASAGPMVVNGLLVRGVSPPSSVVGVRAQNSGATLRLEQLDIDLGPTTTATGVDLASVSPAATGVQLVDGKVKVTGDGNCTTVPTAIRAGGSSVVVDRMHVLALEGGAPHGLELISNTTGEVYSSLVWTGRANGSCAPAPAAPLFVSGSTLYAANDTIEAEGDPMQTIESAAIHARGASQLFMTSNLIGGGRGASHAVLSGDAGVPVPASWRNNYAWYERQGSPPDPNEQILGAFSAPASTVDARGNIFNLLVSCYASPQQSPRTLITSGGCVDTGFLGTRQNGTPVLTDLFDNPRDGGVGPDIGCCER